MGGRGKAWVRSSAIVLSVGACLLSAAALAQERIGQAAIARNEVTRVDAGRTSAIGVGDPVFRNEVVRTGAESAAKFVFVDETNLALGPVSTVTLDRFVFAGQATYSQAVVNLAKGAFRFTTGNSDKRAYEIRTNVATLGVRGTILDVLVEDTRTTATLQEGRAIACARRVGPGDRRAGGCLELTQPGDTAIITARGVVRAGGGRGRGFDFATVCAGDAGLCGQTTFAQGGAPNLQAALCGR